MSDDFIPLNQSTPVGGRGKWQGKQQRFHLHNQSNHQHNHSNHQHNQSNQHHNHSNQFRGRGNNRWGNSPRYSSGGSDSNTSYNNDRTNIDAYLHPSMMQDPWAELRRKNDATSKLPAIL